MTTLAAALGPVSPRRNRQATKRHALREQLWPNSGDEFWNRTKNKGFTTIPRLLPLIMGLIRSLSGRLDPTLLYLELWARVFDEGLVSITNEKELAYSAGYDGTRAERTMRERLFKLKELGFIKTHEDGIREFAHIMLVNPITRCSELHAEGKAPDAWWAAFVRRAGEVGAELPAAKPEHLKRNVGKPQVKPGAAKKPR
ncbi:MAG TPA: hypothetical protein VMF30_06660 [Pirellulales bacterium]|nr:hypothetical protein [Pirellulales bacterium]